MESHLCNVGQAHGSKGGPVQMQSPSGGHHYVGDVSGWQVMQLMSRAGRVPPIQRIRQLHAVTVAESATAHLRVTHKLHWSVSIELS